MFTKELKNVTNNMDVKSYADTLKSEKMLIIKSTNQDKKAAGNMRSIMSKVRHN